MYAVAAHPRTVAARYHAVAGAATVRRCYHAVAEAATVRPSHPRTVAASATGVGKRAGQYRAFDRKVERVKIGSVDRCYRAVAEAATIRGFAIDFLHKFSFLQLPLSLISGIGYKHKTCQPKKAI